MTGREVSGRMEQECHPEESGRLGDSGRLGESDRLGESGSLREK